MQKLTKARTSLNREKRDLIVKGTSYRKATAVFASKLLNDLISSESSQIFTRFELDRMAKTKFNVNDERAADIAKSIHIHLKKIEDQERLASYYKRAAVIMENKR